MPKKGAIQLLSDLTEKHFAKYCDHQEAAPELSRRGFLQLSAFAVGSLALGPALAKVGNTQERCLAIHCPNTGETMRVVYWTPDEGYIKPSIDELSWVMRDYHTNSIKPIDPKLLDQLYALQLKLEPKKPIHVICGYRTPSTNARMRRRNRGVAKDSLHMRGMAADIRVTDRNVKDVHRAALAMRAGGVGYYPRSRFVHIDTGQVRNWG